MKKRSILFEDTLYIYIVNALKYGPLKRYKGKINEKWEIIAFLLNNFFQIRYLKKIRACPYGSFVFVSGQFQQQTFIYIIN
jgi:hypothetical protein